jgi:3(or 17)beta-hydroxysteroid dehydrogenase
MASLTGACALVTGGASGIGLAISKRLVADGAHVAVSDIRPNEGQAVAAENDFTFIEQDVRDEQQWEQVIAQVEEVLGKLTVLVNNAGILGPVDPADPVRTTFADWKNILAVNLDSVFLGCRAGIPAIAKAGGGSIVNMSSIGALIATPQVTAYGVSKAGVRQLTKSVAQYCAQEKLNIRCNSVHPGYVHTALWDRAATETEALIGLPAEDYIASGAKAVPLGGFTTPDDIAASVAFLCSHDARHITGEQLIVDGGVYHCETWDPEPGT